MKIQAHILSLTPLESKCMCEIYIYEFFFVNCGGNFIWQFFWAFMQILKCLGLGTAPYIKYEDVCHYARN